MPTISKNEVANPSAQPSERRVKSLLTGSGAAYLAGRYGLGVFVSLGNMLVLTWWIGPHAYGLFVTAIGLVAFLSTLARAGVDTYLVRKIEAPDQRTYAVAHTLVLAVSLSLVLFGIAAVPPLIHWLGGREFVAPYLFLLLSVPVIGLTGIPTAKLERELNFRRLAWMEVAGQCLGLFVSCILAWFRLGVWAAVGGQTAWQLFLLVSVYICAGMAPRLAFDTSQIRSMLGYGISVTASMRAWQMRTLVNPLFVGRFAGTDGVAFVALAIRIAEALGTIRIATARVAIAALARLQHDAELLRSTLEESLYLQILLLGPLLCTFTVFGPLIVHHIIGARWMPSLAVYPFVAAGVLVNSVYNLQASALFVGGRPVVVMRSYSLHVALLSAGAYFLLPRFGLAGYGWAELLACAGYGVIHLSFGGTLSYSKLFPWLALFLAIIFFPLTGRSWIAELLPILTMTAAICTLAMRNSSRLADLYRWMGRRLSPVVGLLGVLTFAALMMPPVRVSAIGETQPLPRAPEVDSAHLLRNALSLGQARLARHSIRRFALVGYRH